MQLTTLSPTKLEQSRLCRARLKAKYTNDSDYEEDQGDFAKRGTLAHEAAKVHYRGGYCVDATGKIVAGTPGENGLTWVESKSVDQAFKAALDLCAASKNYDGTPNSQVPDDPSGVEEARTLFEQIAAFYPRETVKVVFVERKYKGTLHNGVPVSLIIDLGLDVGGGVLEIIDYKTGFITISDEEMADKDQVLMNLLATRYDPELAAFSTHQFRYFWVRDGYQSKPFSMDWSRLTDYERWLAHEWQDILNDNDPKETINRFCYSCGRRKECKKFAEWLGEAYGGLKIPTEAELHSLISSLHGLQGPQFVTVLAQKLMEQYGTIREWKPEDAVALTMDHVMERADRLGTQIKLLEKNEKVLKDKLKADIEKQNAKGIEGETWKCTKVGGSASTPDPEIVLAACQQYGIKPSKVVSISKEKVESTFAQHAEAIKHINNTAHRFPRSAWIKITKLSPKKRAERKPRAKKDQQQQAAPVAPEVKL
jgi:phosphoglycolate phosphatase-like HAD superfamily hydrolase